MCITPCGGSGFKFIANLLSNCFGELGEVGELGAGGDCDIIFILDIVM